MHTETHSWTPNDEKVINVMCINDNGHEANLTIRPVQPQIDQKVHLPDEIKRMIDKYKWYQLLFLYGSLLFIIPYRFGFDLIKSFSAATFYIYFSILFYVHSFADLVDQVEEERMKDSYDSDSDNIDWLFITNLYYLKSTMYWNKNAYLSNLRRYYLKCLNNTMFFDMLIDE